MYKVIEHPELRYNIESFSFEFDLHICIYGWWKVMRMQDHVWVKGGQSIQEAVTERIEEYFPIVIIKEAIKHSGVVTFRSLEEIYHFYGPCIAGYYVSGVEEIKAYDPNDERERHIFR